MNLDTVRKCAEMAARQQAAALGSVDADIQALLNELAPAEVVQESAPVAEQEPAAEVVNVPAEKTADPAQE